MGICASKKLDKKNKKKIHMKISCWEEGSSNKLYSIKSKISEKKDSNYIFTKSKIFCIDESNKFYFLNDISNNEETKKIMKIKININRETKNEIEILNFEKNKKKYFWRFPNEFKNGKPYEIVERDFIKLGKQILQIEKLNILSKLELEELKNKEKKTSKLKKNSKFEKNTKNELIKKQNENNSQIYKKQDSRKSLSVDSSLYNSKILTCRICYDPETEENPFEENLCNCSRTMPGHIKCISMWLKKKCNNSKNPKIQFWDFTKLFCDICKKKYPEKIKVKNKEIYLINFSENFKNLKNFVLINIFDIVTGIKNGILILNLENNFAGNFKIGRRGDNDIVFKDISVSRLHGYFYFSKKKFFAIDNYSKFGILIRNDESFFLGKNNYFIFENYFFDFCEFLENKKFCCPNKKECIVDPLILSRLFFNEKIKIEDKNEIFNEEKIFIHRKNEFISENIIDKENNLIRKNISARKLKYDKKNKIFPIKNDNENINNHNLKTIDSKNYLENLNNHNSKNQLENIKNEKIKKSISKSYLELNKKQSKKYLKNIENEKKKKKNKKSFLNLESSRNNLEEFGDFYYKEILENIFKEKSGVKKGKTFDFIENYEKLIKEFVPINREEENRNNLNDTTLNFSLRNSTTYEFNQNHVNTKIKSLKNQSSIFKKNQIFPIEEENN